jgi:8-oxo-dGTP pyrophosphatase MutT (NUDIX family)
MRTLLSQKIQNYKSKNDEESAFIEPFLTLLKSQKRCFYRDCFPDHITGSALLLNKAGDQILMNHHASLDKWLNFGGHADGDEDILSVAIRETMEESGITAFKPISSDIIDIDIHTIPANPKKNEPEHQHFDIRYVMQMTDEQIPVLSSESKDLQWMTVDQAKKIIGTNDSLHRLIGKLKNLL